MFLLHLANVVGGLSLCLVPQTRSFISNAWPLFFTLFRAFLPCHFVESFGVFFFVFVPTCCLPFRKERTAQQQQQQIYLCIKIASRSALFYNHFFFVPPVFVVVVVVLVLFVRCFIFLHHSSFFFLWCGYLIFLWGIIFIQFVCVARIQLMVAQTSTEWRNRHVIWIVPSLSRWWWSRRVAIMANENWLSQTVRQFSRPAGATIIPEYLVASQCGAPYAWRNSNFIKC